MPHFWYNSDVRHLRLVSFFLRVGLASVFLYAAIAAFLEPISWVGFLPVWLRNIFPENILLLGFSVYELVLSLWLLSGYKASAAAAFSGLTLLFIIIYNLGALDIIFRDVAIFFSALALLALSLEQK